jgi:hypothetical protein
MKLGGTDSGGFQDDRTGSATTRFALGALAILLASLLVGDELAKLGQNNDLPNIDVARNAPVFRGGQVDSTPTGAIKGPGRTPCGERLD